MTSAKQRHKQAHAIHLLPRFPSCSLTELVELKRIEMLNSVYVITLNGLCSIMIAALQHIIHFLSYYSHSFRNARQCIQLDFRCGGTISNATISLWLPLQLQISDKQRPKKGERNLLATSVCVVGGGWVLLLPQVRHTRPRGFWRSGRAPKN